MVKKLSNKAQTPSDDSVTQKRTKPKAEANFPIVGIGASAGGLEACNEFFGELPVNTGMAFVLVQHLDPHHKSMLTELLSRVTRLPIHEVVDGMVVEPNQVYIIPPNTALGILNKVLHLLPRCETSHPPLPIDYFMQSLAEDLGSMAIGVILSGGASDGTIGLKHIKAAGGITFAQDEGSAKYNSMPHSAVAAGCVDFVLPPAEIARELMRIARQPRVLNNIAAVAETELAIDNGDDLNKIFLLLRNRTGNDFSQYKHSTIRRRIQRRMVLHKLDRLKDYLRYLHAHPSELDELFQDILINVTGFFRDPDTFDALKEKVLPAITQRCTENASIRIWVAGCSTGEEAYSIAMTLLEYFADKATGIPIQIFASDIDAKAIDKARAGIYPEGIKADVSAARLQRFFTKVPTGYQISKSIRDLCLFAVQNVAKDPPFSRMDLICCRNLLIYLNNVLQKKVLQVFHYSLKANGFLLLGGSESISGSADLFSMLDKKNKIYSKKSIATLQRYTFNSTPAYVAPYFHEPPSSAQTVVTMTDVIQQAERLILNEYGPPAVITNQEMDILHFSGHTGPYIEPAQGSASLNLMKMARVDLVMELRAAVRQVLKDNARVRRENVRVKVGHGERRIQLQVIPLKGPGAEQRAVLILFEEPASGPLPASVAAASSPSTDNKAIADDNDWRIQEVEQALLATREYLQSVIEGQETNNEELQSANEEIQSANEELQSTNEELETAKEELQSTNEELVTVNEELEGRNTELIQLNNDLSNLLNSVQLPIIMLNEDLKIRHFTPGATRLFNLIHSDAGRAISDIKANVTIPDMEACLIRVMDTIMLETMEVRDKVGNWYNLYVRPYKTRDNRIAGVVLVFVAMSSALERRLAAVVRDASDAITLQDFDGNILAWNRSAEKIFGYSESEALGMNARSLVPESAWLKEAALLAALQRGEEVAPREMARVTKNGQIVKVWLTSTVLLDEHGRPYAIAATARLIRSLGE